MSFSLGRSIEELAAIITDPQHDMVLDVAVKGFDMIFPPAIVSVVNQYMDADSKRVMVGIFVAIGDTPLLPKHLENEIEKHVTLFLCVADTVRRRRAQEGKLG